MLRHIATSVLITAIYVLCSSVAGFAVNLNHEPAKGVANSGPDEAYNVVFNYELKNRTSEELKNVKVWIPLPFDDAGQKITGFKLLDCNFPSQQVKTTDQFGQQILAVTIDSIGPHTTAKLGYDCDVVLHPVRVPLDRERSTQNLQIPEEIRKLYTGDIVDVYDLSSPAIKEQASKFCESYPNPVDRVVAIHDLVAGSVKYHMTGGWSAAPVVLRRKTGSCSEYSFLFAALCRASGFPTRLVGSSHLRTTTDFPYRDTAWHRWIEVYIPGLEWVPFDPTLDRGRKPLRDCVGSYDFRTLRVSRGGCESSVLGQAYVGCNDQEKSIERNKYFVWTRR